MYIVRLKKERKLKYKLISCCSYLASFSRILPCGGFSKGTANKAAVYDFQQRGSGQPTNLRAKKGESHKIAKPAISLTDNRKHASEPAKVKWRYSSWLKAK